MGDVLRSMWPKELTVKSVQGVYCFMTVKLIDHAITASWNINVLQPTLDLISTMH